MRLRDSFLPTLLLLYGCVSSPVQPLKEVDNKPLAPGDCIAVSLVQDGMDEKPKVYLLDSAGDVSLLFIPKIHLAGLTPNKAEQQIYDAYVPKYFS